MHSPELWFLGSEGDRYRDRLLHAEDCWSLPCWGSLVQWGWALGVLSPSVASRRNLYHEDQGQANSSLRSKSSSRCSNLGWNPGRQNMPVGDRTPSSPEKMMLIILVIKCSRKWVFESSLSLSHTHTCMDSCTSQGRLKETRLLLTVKETKSILSFHNKSKRRQAVPKNKPTENMIHGNMTDQEASAEQISMCKYLGWWAWWKFKL